MMIFKKNLVTQIADEIQIAGVAPLSPRQTVVKRVVEEKLTAQF